MKEKIQIPENTEGRAIINAGSLIYKYPERQGTGVSLRQFSIPYTVGYYQTVPLMPYNDSLERLRRSLKYEDIRGLKTTAKS